MHGHALLPMQSNDYLTTLATKEEKMVMLTELGEKNIHLPQAVLQEQLLHQRGD